MDLLKEGKDVLRSEITSAEPVYPLKRSIWFEAFNLA
jgi:hypothetical protein